MNKKLALALCTSAVLAATATGCGDDTDEQTDAWAEKVCSQVEPQAEKIKNANAAISEVSGEDSPPAEVQKADSQAFQQLSEAYGALAQAVNKAGDPPVDNGAELRENAVQELNDISDAYAGLKKRVDGLDVKDQGEFADGLNGIVEELNQLGQGGDDALNDLQSGELGQAMSEQDGCRRPGASGGEESPDAS
ncbi:small secreted protein [Streptomyces sp. TRM 70351]|uniref:small secreted protein n=1 Tax=Streptomyces sp. TRM 70351 TaxID=3116552 RepID=UPI002E7B50E4|nr:small secreted protein [Streptomyces sp. TRM 70351]MEE1930282.1 small secreted protein [Streptomyces sp. TRM 70351]